MEQQDLELSYHQFLDLVEDWIKTEEKNLSRMWPQKGGWEGYAQAAIYSYILSQDSRYEILREQHVYRNNREAADFLLNGASWVHDKVIVELKCQSFENWKNFRKGLEKDKNSLIHNLKDAYERATLLILGIYFTEHADIPVFFNTKVIGSGEVGICWALDLG